MNLIITGSLAYDHIMVFRDQFKKHILPDKIHILNVAFNVDSLKKEFGGTAPNIAYNLFLLGDKPLMVGTVGKDFGMYAKRFEKLGLDISQVKVLEDEFTAQCFITTDLDDNQITAFHGGAMFRAQEKFLESSFVQKDDVVIISPNGKEAMLSYAKYCKKNTIKFVFDPGQSIPAFSKEELLESIKKSYLLIVNDYEWQLIQNKTGLNQNSVFDYVENLIVTLGEKGSKLITKEGEREQMVGVVKVKQAVDPTGCGDAYRAGLLFGLKQNLDLLKSMEIASTLASFAVEKHGTQNHKPTLGEIKERQEKAFGEKNVKKSNSH